MALEAKSAMVEKLQARLVAAEEAMREGEEREQELEHRLAQHEGNSVMKEADALEGEMAGAFASLRSGFGSFLGGKGGGDDAAGNLRLSSTWAGTSVHSHKHLKHELVCFISHHQCL